MKTSARIISSLGIVLLISLLVVTMLVAVARSGRVQTAVLRVVTEQLSRGWGAPVEVGAIAYKFPNRLLVEDVLLGDRQGDTLLFVDTLQARMDVMKLLRNDTLSIRRVDLCGLRFNAYRLPDSTMNYRFLIDAFRSDEEKEKKPFPLNMEVKDICLRRLSLRHDEWSGEVPEADLHLHALSAHDIDAEIERFSAVVSRDGTPLELRTLEARFVKHDELLSFPKLHIELPRSELTLSELQVALPAPEHGSDQLHDIALRIEDARLTPADLQAVLPACRTMNSPWQMTADVRGRVDSLVARDLSVAFRGETVLLGEATALGLPSLDSLRFRIRCTDLTTRRAQLQDIISAVAGRPVQLLPMLAQLGTVHYRGTLEGRLADMKLAGAFTSAVGSIRTDGHASIASDFSDISYRGAVSTRRLMLGRLLSVPDLGAVAFAVTTDGHVAEGEPFEGSVCAKVNTLEYRGYSYHDLHVDGRFANRIFTGEAECTDPNLDFAFRGRMDFGRTDNHYAYTLALHHLRLGELHLSDKYADSDLRFGLALDLQGGSLDALHGYLHLDTLAFVHRGEELRMEHFVLDAEAPASADDVRSLLVRSDYLDADVAGHFRYQDVPASVMRFIGQYLPMMIQHDKRAVYLSSEVQNDLRFSVTGRHLDRVMNHLELGASVVGSPRVEGHIDDRAESYALMASVPELYLGTKHFSGLRLDLVNSDQAIGLAAGGLMHHSDVKLSETLGDLRLGLSARVMRDSLFMAASWTNPDTVHNAGRLSLGAHFAQYQHLPLVTVHVHPDTLLMADSVLYVSPSVITYTAADTALQVDHFRIGSATHFVYADGVASRSMQDTLYAQLSDVNLDYVLSIVAADLKKTIFFGGNVTGWAQAYGLLRAPMFEADVKMVDASINGSPIGDVYAMATLDRDSGRVLIQGDCIDRRLPYAPAAIDTIPARRVYSRRPYDLSALDSMRPATFYAALPDTVRRSGRHVVHVDGEIGGGPGRWGLGIYPDSVELGFIHHWAQTILSEVKGRGTGSCFVLGDKWPSSNQPRTVVKVAAKPHHASVRLPFTGARYFADDTIRMDTTYIAFRDMHLTDEEGHPVLLDGALTHDGNFRDMRFRFDVEARKALVLDLPEDGKELYGGHVYADGTVVVSGDEHDVNIVADAKTTKGSRFMLSLATGSSADETEWVEYVSQADTLTVDSVPSSALDRLRDVALAAHSHFNMQLRVEVTPEADVSVLIDRRTGDRIRGRGEGNLRLLLNDDDVSLHGTYTMQQGTFGFTFQNVIRREFRITEGSQVIFSGNPEEPEVDIRAYYRVTASLRDLLGSDVSSVTNHYQTPVNCILHLTQSLMNPTVNFGVELPQADEAVASQVRAVINTEEMLMRQVLYLLVFGKFYTPEYLQNTSNVGLNETYSLISSTVTGQINSWLGKITDVVTLGFNVRTDGDGEDVSQEYEAEFEIHPVAGLLINGNLGYRYNDISNQPVFGNLDVEYMLTPNGKLRAKAFTHTVDKYSLRQANTVQGVGFVLRHDFNWPSLKDRKSKKAKSSAGDSTAAADQASSLPNDSTAAALEILSSPK